ncbi:MAG: type I-E CRISPR-associated protein Cas6/Cse3/CasE [Actinomycetota bacterium]|nr:type I-E CRISPR-associated protein Cas6/Cse3/CasE [Actinomycetota bacterium]
MFLTRFDINQARRGAKKLMGSPQAMHAAVLAGFPPTDGESGDQRVLWRVDSTGARNLLYIVSPQQPDLTHLVEQAGWPQTATWLTKDYQPLLDSLTAGQQWGFRLTANVTISTKRGKEDVRSQRYGHVTADQQREWFASRAGKFGFSLAANTDGYDALEVRDRAVKQFRRQDQQVTLAVATFVGVLVVTDADALRAALVTGIGPAKAYGCGLLTLAPIG